MADSQDDQTPRKGAMWPFLAAVIVIVLAVGAVLISNVIEPGDEKLTDSAQVQHAINDSYTARNGLDYAKFQSVTCTKVRTAGDFPDESAFVEQNRQSRDQFGKIVIPEITDVVVDGDRATAKVHWNFEKSGSDAKTVTSVVVVREGDEWKVCR